MDATEISGLGRRLTRFLRRFAQIPSHLPLAEDIELPEFPEPQAPAKPKLGERVRATVDNIVRPIATWD